MTAEMLEQLLRQLSLDEKINQMIQIVGQFYEDSGILTGPISKARLKEENIRLAGSILGSVGAKQDEDTDGIYGK